MITNRQKILPMNTLKAAKADFVGCFRGEVREKNSSLFPVDFDDSHFESFSKFKLNRNEAAGEKQKVKSKTTKRITINSPKWILIKDSIERINRHIQENPTFLKRWPEFKDPKFIRRYATNQIAEQKRVLKAAARKRAKNVAAILKEFETSSNRDRLNLNNQSEVKDNIREILLEYLTDEAVFISTLFDIDVEKIPTDGIPDEWPRVDAIHVPQGYTLSGARAGAWFPIKKENVPAIVNEALFWKSRRTLGLLWTLADHGDKEALLKLAKAFIPFIKATNEKLSEHPDLLGLWPKQLPYWPVMKSLHRDYDCDHVILLKTIHIGDELPLRFDEAARWEFNPITKWAIHLIEEIENRCGWLCDDPDLPDILRKQLSKLQKFSSNTWLAWWDAAKEVLEHCYVDLATIPELQNWVNSPKAREKIWMRTERWPHLNIERDPVKFANSFTAL